jgi:hypothetical protein
MPEDERIAKLAQRLRKATQAKEVKWDYASPPDELTTANNDHVFNYLVTQYKNQRIAIFENRSSYYDGERDTYFYSPEIHLAFVSSGGDIRWDTTEQQLFLEQLYEDARKSAADVDNLIDELLT